MILGWVVADATWRCIGHMASGPAWPATGALCRGLALLLWLGLSGPVGAATSAWLAVEGLDGVSARMAVALDPDSQLNTLAALRATAFTAPPDDHTGRISSIRVWWRIDLAVPPALVGQTVWLRVVPALVHEARLFTADGALQRSGLSLPLADHSHPGVPARFRLTLDQPDTRVYLMVETALPQLSHTALLSDAALRAELQRDTLRQGLFIGAALMMLIQAVMNWVSIGHPAYRDFAVYISTSLVFILFLNGHVANHLLPDVPWLVTRLSYVSGAALMAGTILFSLQVLEIHQRLPRVAVALRWVMAGAVLSSLAAVDLALVPIASTLLWLLHLAVGLLLLGISLQQALLRRQAQAWVVFCAYLLFTMFEKAPLLAMAGWLPVTVWIGELARIGLVVQMLLVHLQLVIRVRQQRHLAQLELAARLEAQAERAQRHDLLQFLAMFGHEVRTPLAIIDAAAQSLELLPGGDTPRFQQRHRKIRAAVDRLDRLSREALSRERIEAGAWRPRPRAVVLAEVVDHLLALRDVTLPSERTAAELMLPLAVGGQAGGRLALTLPGGAPAWTADPDLIEVALANLLDNARKYADPGSLVRLDVDLPAGAMATPASIRFRVGSQGPVLSDTDRVRMFDKYWRLDEHHNLAGAGLGLHLVRNIVKAHGGAVHAQSLPQRWTCLTVVLPLQPTAFQAGGHTR